MFEEVFKTGLRLPLSTVLMELSRSNIGFVPTGPRFYDDNIDETPCTIIIDGEEEYAACPPYHFMAQACQNLDNFCNSLGFTKDKKGNLFLSCKPDDGSLQDVYIIIKCVTDIHIEIEVRDFLKSLHTNGLSNTPQNREVVSGVIRMLIQSQSKVTADKKRLRESVKDAKSRLGVCLDEKDKLSIRFSNLHSDYEALKEKLTSAENLAAQYKNERRGLEIQKGKYFDDLMDLHQVREDLLTTCEALARDDIKLREEEIKLRKLFQCWKKRSNDNWDRFIAAKQKSLAAEKKIPKLMFPYNFSILCAIASITGAVISKSINTLGMDNIIHYFMDNIIHYFQALI